MSISEKISTALCAPLLFAVGLTLLLSSCSQEDTDFDTQDSYIVSFLTTSHDPILIAESNIEYSPESEPEFYTKFINSSYRYIHDYYSSDRASKTEVTSSSIVTITFWSYDFSSYTMPTSSTAPFFTNDATIESALEEYGLNTEFWDFSPLEIDLSKDDILIGLNRALVGCRDGDYVEIYMTYNVAYGNTAVGVIPELTPIAMFVQIESVK